MLETLKPENLFNHDRGSALTPVLMFVTGLALGGATAALLTPHSGRDLRRQLRSGLQRWSDRARAPARRRMQRAMAEPLQGQVEPLPDGDTLKRSTD